MKRYKIWDKQEAIYTIGADEHGHMKHTSSEYMAEKAPWAENPNVKIIVGGGTINGTVFQEFQMTVDHYVAQGLELTAGMSDQDILDAIEYFEDNPPQSDVPTAEERMAAALEFANILNM